MTIARRAASMKSVDTSRQQVPDDQRVHMCLLQREGLVETEVILAVALGMIPDT